MAALLLASLALCSAAQADDCDARAAELVARLGGKVDVRTAVGNIIVKHPAAKSMTIICPFSRFPISLSAFSDSQYPQASFYDLTAAGAEIITGIPADIVREGLICCQKKALSTEQQETINFGELNIGCEAGKIVGTEITLRRKMPGD